MQPYDGNACRFAGDCRLRLYAIEYVYISARGVVVVYVQWLDCVMAGLMPRGRMRKF